jgi:hypothetical protein
MNLNEEPRLPRDSLSMLVIRLTDLLRDILRQLNKTTARTDTPVAAASSVTVGASPFSYTPDNDGLLIVVGGVVTALAYGRQGTFTALGVVAGLVPVKSGDTVRITHTAAPAVSFIRQ